jgi:hypothetical protein
MGDLIKRTIIAWIPLAILASMTAFLTYTAVQQSQRSWANDPQIQMAEDAARALEAGADPASIVGATQIDAGLSLAPFIIVYDQDHASLASGALLSGKPPVPPGGVFDYVLGKSRDGGPYSLRKTDVPGEERFSWEPEPNIRFATVVTHYGGAHPGFVLAARSLREIEKREHYTFFISLFAYALGLGMTLVWCLLIAIFDRKRYNGT